MSSEALLELARERFRDDWTDADETLFRQTAKGKIAAYGKGDPADADKWAKDRVLRADRIEWLCTDRDAVKEVTRKGVRIKGARIEGHVDLSYVKIEFPLWIVNSAVQRGFTMQRCHLRTLLLNGTHTGPIVADGLRVEHDVFMRDGFQSTGEVRLLSAKISGTLDCRKGQFSNPDGKALNADRVDVKGTVCLTDGFQAMGEVRLLGATIGRSLDCVKGHFSNPDGKALSADGIEVKGDVFLRDEFQATGEVRLLGATIGGVLACAKGRFSNPDGKALSADGVQVDGSVFLNDGFQATGEVRLLGATIGRNLECDNGCFSNPNGKALTAAGVEVKGSVFLRQQFRAEGKVDFIGASVNGSFLWLMLECAERCTLRLESAKIGTLWDEEASWPAKLYLDGLVYDRLHNDAPLSSEARLRWFRRQGYDRDRFVPQPYVQLAKVLQEMGHEADARRILIAKQKDPARVKSLSIPGRVWHHLLGSTFGYGYRPWLALLVAWLLYIALGTGLFQIGIDKALFAETEAGTVPAFNALVYSLDAFVSLVDFHQAKYRLPTGWFLRGYLWIHIGLGWFLTTLLVVGLAGLVRR